MPYWAKSLCVLHPHPEIFRLSLGGRYRSADDRTVALVLGCAPHLRQSAAANYVNP